MPETDLHQPGLGPLSAAAKAAELAQAASGLVGADGYRLAGSDPLVPLVRDIACSVTGADLLILRAFGYAAEPFDPGGAWLVTGHRDQDPGADR
jgi:hypothetical protein